MTIYTFYKIVCNDIKVTQIYVGSTKDLKDRKRIHKYRCNTPDDEGYNTKVYKFIRNNGGWNNWSFNVLDTKECIDKYDSYVIEQSYINELKSELNSISAYTGLNRQEYEIKYYQKNKEKILQYNKKNKENIKEYQNHYRQENKEKIKQYRQENKEKLNEQYCCLICRGHYTHINTSRHFKLQKHLSKLTQLNN